MSQANVDLVRAAYEAVARGDREALDAMLAEHVAPDFKYETFLARRTYKGADGFGKFLDDVQETVSYVPEVPEIVDLDDHVLIELERPGRGSPTGVRVSEPIVVVLTFDGTTLLSGRGFETKAEALAAARLSEAPRPAGRSPPWDHGRRQSRRRLSRPATLAAVAAAAVVVVVIVVALASENDADRPSRQAAARANANGPPRTPKQEVQRVGQTANTWARRFAAGGDTCRNMTQPACEREDCVRVGAPPRKIKNCTRPSPAFRKSFRDVSVEDIVVRGHRAAATFTNGETIELFLPPAVDFWMVHKFGENAGRGLLAD
jgi:ketosteroid isomerase-like protein